MESAGREYISHLSSKNPGTKPSPWFSKQHSTPSCHQNRGDVEGPFWSADPSRALPPLPAIWRQREENASSYMAQ